MGKNDLDAEDLLPLAPQFFHVLLALADDTLHGYGIIQAFEGMTSGRETLLPGSLYAALGRMVDAGLIEEVAPPAGTASGGPARRYYRVTRLGRAAARAESDRLARLLALARSRKLTAARGA
jgi:DNA-binding PadR family transcriptional regulator